MEDQRLTDASQELEERRRERYGTGGPFAPNVPKQYQKPIPTAEEIAEAQRLMALGYRRTSWGHRLVSRIDRPDWLMVLAKELRRAPADFYVPGEPQPAGSWCDHYRRVCSKDNITVSKGVIGLVDGSGFDPIGYVEPPQ